MKIVPGGPIEDKSALVQVMAWRRTGNHNADCDVTKLPETDLKKVTIQIF